MQGAMATTPWKQTFRKVSAVTVLEQSISSTLDSCNDDVYLYGFVCELQFDAVGVLWAQLKLMGFIAPASRCVSTQGGHDMVHSFLSSDLCCMLAEQCYTEI